MVLRRIRDDQYTHGTGSIHAKAFANDRNRETGQQTDSHSVSREKYTSALELQSLAEHPQRFGVAALGVAEYETMCQEVHHTQTSDDEGHCDAVGSKTARVRTHLRTRAAMRILPPQGDPKNGG